MLLVSDDDGAPSSCPLRSALATPAAGQMAAECWPLSPIVSLLPSHGVPAAPGAAAELCFAWREPGSGVLAQRLCGELVIHGVAPEQLLRLRLCSGEQELLGLQTLNGTRGDRITAGEMLWGMAAFQCQDRLGRLTVPLFPNPAALGSVRLHLWLADGAGSGCEVSAVAAPSTAG